MFETRYYPVNFRIFPKNFRPDMGCGEYHMSPQPMFHAPHKPGLCAENAFIVNTRKGKDSDEKY